MLESLARKERLSDAGAVTSILRRVSERV